MIEFSLPYYPSKAIKEQVIIDFVVEYHENVKNFIDLRPWKLYFNDSSHKNV